MCTVSFVNSQGRIIITSNRDERTTRPNAIEPRVYMYNNRKLIYPKDPKAGGTWIAAEEKASVAVLLNGALKPHIPKANYRKSRGLILLDIISKDDSIEECNQINLLDIEPFTLVVYEKKQLYELIWDGNEKSIKKLDSNASFIWSSSTLYTPEQRESKEKSFHSFLAKNDEPTPDSLQLYHTNTGKEEDEEAFVINRNNVVRTFSITQAVSEKNKLIINHFDLLTQIKYSEVFITL